MSNIVGLKGSPRERLSNWLTLLALRESLKYSREKNLASTVDKETSIYKELIERYKKVA